MMNWNTSTDCCNWNGVSCDFSTGDVIGLDVSCGMLKGTIHPNSSLFNLPHLQTLNLAFNDFDGSRIPHEIGRFSNSLTHLNLSHCSFSGQVPTDITLLHKLVSLDLSWNNDHDLKLGPHVFMNMFQNFTNLEELSLEYVNISSVLPDRLDISSSLKLLNLDSTGLKGKLPHYIFNLDSLETLNLGDNSFTGDIPSEVNLTHINSLDLHSNKLNGTLPSWLFTPPSLESLHLNDNMFSGNVPFESFPLSSLKELVLSGNQLAGHTDMQTFQKLTNLTRLGLSSNNFSGEWELDTLLSSLTNLESLSLSYNSFSVTTKNANHYVNPRFSSLSLASCKLKVFPNSIRHMKQLYMLDLSSNEIHGQIPQWAGEIGGKNLLFYLNLSHNFITGLPQFQWYGLEYLYLQSNMIEGPFPPSICNMSQLWYLDMSNNRFGGLIPQCFGNITSSFMIDMGNNSFQGTIPKVYGDCERLRGLSLNGNQLRGEVPSSLSKCSGLNVLDLGNNHLNGTFPSWLGDFPNLRALVLKSNNFHGRIQPSSTVEFPFPSLRLLDLSHNGFMGQLPVKYFQNFNSMMNVIKSNTTPEYLSMGIKYYSFIAAVKGVNQEFPQISVDYTIIDLSDNTFEGEIPHVIGGLNSLIVLNLSHNCLKGPIPHALGNLTEIESLDLSWNQLSGEIPQSLARITTLEVLNLSQNHLVGRIPEGPQFSTFGTSFGGNSGLYGSPLPKREHQSSAQVEDDGEYDDEEESGFTWKVVTLGYGCGSLVGLVMGYLMLSTRKVEWFNAIADATESLRCQLLNAYALWPVINTCIGGNEILKFLCVPTCIRSNVKNAVNGLFYNSNRCLRLASCKLKVFPNSFQAMKQLERFDISSNEILRQIPHWAGEIEGNNGLSNLDLSHSFITGLPQFQWYGLEELFLQSNLIEGPFPASICNMSNLLYLDLSNNCFDGLIPQCFGNIAHILE
ncbi:Leucine-rich repeat-containing protein [Artemisia annua]|uniref:Leucine-rich repeat-containing protein n=1 Tax=Artemisia annua TaxID=35608 RepID=A0A2U1QEF4_ARTAN|nr:Leucine-rich repeat-containing protein [Artemisia annua]